MYSNDMYNLGNQSSVIRELFEFGKKRKAEIGDNNVFDYSIGNPSVPAPQIVKDKIIELLNTMEPTLLHGYTSAAGDLKVRKSIADYLNKKHGSSFTENNIFMTCGAAASVTITLKALYQPEDEVILFAPFFPEYTVFAANAGYKSVIVLCEKDTFQIDFEAFEKAITEHTKAVIIDSPNNPSGVILSKETIVKMCDILREKQKEFGHDIYLISDEPYRELVYDDDVEVPYVTEYYDNSVICYSFSKSLSIPGERIGYILVNNKMNDWVNVYKACAGAARSLGYVCAPSLFQFIIPDCLGYTGDISVYKKNRDTLYRILVENGFSVAKPDGAFYLFVKAAEEDAKEFSEVAKQFELLLVPSDSFGYPGYVRVASCVSYDMIVRSEPAFKKLAEHYGLKG